MEDCLSVRIEMQKIKLSKWLILCNLMEVYRSLKDNFPNMKVRFSEFPENKSKYYLLAVPIGTRTVCICTAHQNIKLKT